MKIFKNVLNNCDDWCYYIRAVRGQRCGLVAQLDRVFDYESKGRRFESCRDHAKPHRKRGEVFVFAVRLFVAFAG